jgi:hypothetical protein
VNDIFFSARSPVEAKAFWVDMYWLLQLTDLRMSVGFC